MQGLKLHQMNDGIAMTRNHIGPSKRACHVWPYSWILVSRSQSSGRSGFIKINVPNEIPPQSPGTYVTVALKNLSCLQPLMTAKII